MKLIFKKTKHGPVLERIKTEKLLLPSNKVKKRSDTLFSIICSKISDGVAIRKCRTANGRVGENFPPYLTILLRNTWKSSKIFSFLFCFFFLITDFLSLHYNK